MRPYLLLLGLLAPTLVFGFLYTPQREGLAQEPKGLDQTPVTFKQNILPFLAQHCYECHGNGKKKAGLALDKYTSDESLLNDRPTWENVVNMVKSGNMPPKERPRPKADDVETVVKAVNSVLNSFDCSKQHNVGRVTLRRLNRLEYNNTIRDLVGVDFKPADDFPNDDVGHGFDNIGDVLSVSPLLLEKYLAAAEWILEQAIADVRPTKANKHKLGNISFNPKGTGENKKGSGNYLFAKGEIVAEADLDEGEYFVRVEVSAQQAGDEPVKGSLRVGQNELKQFELKDANPAKVEGKITIKTSHVKVAVALLNPLPGAKKTDAKEQLRLLFVKSIEMDGPHNAPPPPLSASHKKIMAHKGGLESREAAREIVGRFALLAFRRPVPATEVESLLKLYDKAEKAGMNFEDRIRLALCRVLVSPHFLFRVELDPPEAQPGTAYSISEYQLASRLAYFLWATMPDKELFELAEKGQLRKNVHSQVQRMLKDPKSSVFLQNFAGQWLTIRNLENVNPDPKRFPQFDDELRQAMQRETELFFEAIVREDRSILDLIDADFSFMNERLAKHYGIEGVKGKEFRRIQLPADRGGVLTHASILTITSNPDRTSPVKRGKWVLDNLLNTPPPPPPEDVPDLAEQQKQIKGTLRQQMEMHRKNPMCAACHQRMDAIGFAFENYDAVGAWRDKDDTFTIDPSGVLPDGKAFKGAGELKTILRGQKDLFSRAMSEKMLTYALGRGLEYYDKCAIDKIVTALEKNDYRFSTLLLQVVSSEPFQMRMAAPKKPGAKQ